MRCQLLVTQLICCLLTGCEADKTQNLDSFLHFDIFSAQQCICFTFNFCCSFIFSVRTFFSVYSFLLCILVPVLVFVHRTLVIFIIFILFCLNYKKLYKCFKLGGRKGVVTCCQQVWNTVIVTGVKLPWSWRVRQPMQPSQVPDLSWQSGGSLLPIVRNTVILQCFDIAGWVTGRATAT